MARLSVSVSSVSSSPSTLTVDISTTFGDDKSKKEKGHVYLRFLSLISHVECDKRDKGEETTMRMSVQVLYCIDIRGRGGYRMGNVMDGESKRRRREKGEGKGERRGGDVYTRGSSQVFK